MDEAVIVIADLYLHSGDELSGELVAGPGALAGLDYAGRFGARERLAGGWREWLAGWLGRGDLAGVSVAAVAAAAVAAGAEAAVRWIATPIELAAGLTRVHLDRRGIVRLAPEEQAALADAFHRAFAGSGLTLQPLSDGQFLAVTPGIAPLATMEPARCAGGGLVVPHGASAAPLLRLMGEIEMWLHEAALNRARAARGERQVTTLWLWGAAGAALPPHPPRRADGATEVFGSDAFLAGLLRLDGRALRALPQPPTALFAAARSARAAWVVELAAETPAQGPWVLSTAAAALERRLIGPALEALRDGSLKRLTLIANDTLIAVGRHSGLKRWRRPRAGWAAFA